MKRRIAAVALAIAAAAALLLLPTREILDDLITFARDAGPWAPAWVALIFTTATLLAIPFWILAVGAGIVLGGPAGAAVSFLSNAAGGSLAFHIARRTGLRPLQAFLARRPAWQAVSEAFGRRAFRLVLLTRLSPVLPSNLLNYAFGASPVGFRPFLAGTALGMLPTLALYTWIGTTVRSVAEAASAGRSLGGPEKLLLGAGLAVTLAAALYAGRVAREAIRDSTARSSPS